MKNRISRACKDWIEYRTDWLSRVSKETAVKHAFEDGYVLGFRQHQHDVAFVLSGGLTPAGASPLEQITPSSSIKEQEKP